MRTLVAPAVGPDGGETPVTVGTGPVAGASKVNAPVSVFRVPSRSTTVTSTAPAPWAGVVAVIVVASTTVTADAVEALNSTPTPARNAAPVSVTVVPPTAGPCVGAIAVSANEEGGAWYVNAAASLALRPSGFVTTTSTGPPACPGVVAAIEVAPFTATPLALAPPRV